MNWLTSSSLALPWSAYLMSLLPRCPSFCSWVTYIKKKTFVYFELMILVLVVLIMKVNKVRQIKTIFQKISESSDRS